MTMYEFTSQEIKAKNWDPAILDREPSEPSEPKRKAAIEKIQRKQAAYIIAGNEEMIMQYAVENDVVSLSLLFCCPKDSSVDMVWWQTQTIPATRAYFKHVSLGAPTAEIIKDWYPIRPSTSLWRDFNASAKSITQQTSS